MAYIGESITRVELVRAFILVISIDQARLI